MDLYGGAVCQKEGSRNGRTAGRPGAIHGHGPAMLSASFGELNPLGLDFLRYLLEFSASRPVPHQGIERLQGQIEVDQQPHRGYERWRNLMIMVS